VTAGELRVDHVVKTADGLVCRVSYIHQVGLVELDPLDGGATLTLPREELRRVPDPRNQRPPIDGMPDPRPLCAWCARKLRPTVNEEREGTAVRGRIVRRTFVRWNAYEGVFCTASCAIAFAGASYRGGYRRNPVFAARPSR